MSNQENNKLIAEFMGFTLDTPTNIEGAVWYDNEELYLHISSEFKHSNCFKELQFHTSWEWLMSVVDKIECTTIDNDDNSDNFFNVMIEVFECNINGGDICICESGHTKREAIYKAVVEFINQYNKNL